DLVDDTRIRDGQLALRRAAFDLCALVRSAVEEQRMLERDRVIHVCARCALADSAPMSVEADADRIGQVITNYLSNALKYSRADRPVEVVVEAIGRTQGAGEMEEGNGAVDQAHLASMADTADTADTAVRMDQTGVLGADVPASAAGLARVM